VHISRIFRLKQIFREQGISNIEANSNLQYIIKKYLGNESGDELGTFDEETKLLNAKETKMEHNN
jgi:hypothetical protein